MRLAIFALVLATITATVTAGSNKQTCDECHNRIQGCLLVSTQVDVYASGG